MDSSSQGIYPPYVTLHQVFFVDSTGALCSRASGHAIDIDGEPCLRTLWNSAVWLEF